MKLSDIMSSMQLSAYAEVALLLFLGAFGAIVISLCWNRKRDDWDHYRHLPLDPAEDGGTLPVMLPPATTSERARQP